MAKRLRLTWLLAFPLMVAGSAAAHALGQAVLELRPAAPDDHDALEGASRIDHGSVTGLPLVAGLIVAFALVGVGHLITQRLRHRPPGRVSPWAFALLPPLAYVIQESAERLLRAETFPFNPAHEPAFLLALALQIPFGIAAFWIGRGLLRLGRTMARGLATVSAGWPDPPELPGPLRSAHGLPRRSIIRAGPSERAPPSLAVS